MLPAPEPRDAPTLVRLFTDPKVRRYLGGPLSQEAAEVRVAGLIEGAGAGAGAGVIREDGEAVGLIWLSPHHGSDDMELSFVLLREWQGKGVAFRACTEALRFAFDQLGLERVVSETQVANKRSIALLERLGMNEDRRLERFGEAQVIYAIRAGG
ncbi:GNAT family N-acetyltransferase [Luteolibacter luteus]|uniref:GNAT family N-acetyltransferase n=1 Tax=Luteolibacter luteus TaxID=2728835 RepID=A0A858RND6_9BACT|nr:GNAT family N-acetyltransferase [Luteolibacter luteus]QJE98926.1 GNAT family N-acetyltransferase [Luteolibacter luteus]